MGMTIDESIEVIKHEKPESPTSMYGLVKKNAFNTAIDTMRKYQKIEQIINNAKDSDGAVKYNWLYEQIRKVLEDGKID